MSPKTKTSIANLATFVGAVVAVTGLLGSAKRFGDASYVRADTFALHVKAAQQQRVVDSVIHSYELEKLAQVKADVDTIKQCLRHRASCQ